MLGISLRRYKSGSPQCGKTPKAQARDVNTCPRPGEVAEKRHCLGRAGNGEHLFCVSTVNRLPPIARTKTHELGNWEILFAFSC